MNDTVNLHYGTIVSPIRNSKDIRDISYNSYDACSQNMVNVERNNDENRNRRRLPEADSSTSLSPNYLNQERDTKVKPVNHAFKLMGKVAEGGYGAVFKARMCRVKENAADQSDIIRSGDLEETEEIIAVKILTSDISIIGIPSIGEIDVLARIRHPHLMSMHQICVADLCSPITTKTATVNSTAIAISMPWAKYGNLYNFITNYELDFRSMVYILMQVLQAVEYLHSERILHMDIKMENVLVMSIDPLVVKLGDFGMITYADRRGVRDFDQEAVTVTYRSPELFNYPGNYSTNNDIWSIGIMFLYMLLRREHIFPHLEPLDKVREFVCRTFNDTNRHRNLVKYLTEDKNLTSMLSSKELKLSLEFLNRALNYSTFSRPSARQLLQDPIFSILTLSDNDYNSVSHISSANMITTKYSKSFSPRSIQYKWGIPNTPQGAIIFRRIWKQPVDKITAEAYLALDYLIRLFNKLNLKVETFFIAADLFNRTLGYLYTLHSYYLSNPLEWKHGCRIGEVLTLGATVCLWIAEKTIEDKYHDVQGIHQMVNRYYSTKLITDMERHLVVCLDGIIYQWNPFLNCSTIEDLVIAFNEITDIFNYQNYTIKKHTVDCNNLPHTIQFNTVYNRTQYIRNLPKDRDKLNEFIYNLYHTHRRVHVSQNRPMIYIPN